jgi:protease I
MAAIAALLGDMFEDSEYTEPVQSFIQNGHTVTTIGLQAGETVHGKREQTPVTIDRAVAECNPADFDALLLAGGYSPDNLRADEDAVQFVKHWMESGKPVFAICHGPQLLISADALRDRTVTGWKSIVQDIRNAGATCVDREVAVDGNLVTSRCPDDLPAFIKASLQKLS